MLEKLFLFSVLSGVLNLIILIFKNYSLKSLGSIIGLYAALILAVCEPIINPYLISHFHWYLFKEFPVSFIHFPMIYFYLAYYLNIFDNISRRVKIIMFIPMVVDLLIYISVSVYFSIVGISKLEQMEIISNSPLYLFRTILALLFNLSVLIFIIKMLLDFWNKIKVLKYRFLKIQVYWVLAILLAATTILIIDLGYVFSGAESGSIESEDFLYLFNAVFVVLFGYLAISVPNMVEEFTIIKEELNSQIEAQNSFSDNKPSISNGEIDIVFEKITTYMIQTEAYTNTEFTMQFLALENEESVFTISTAINKRTGNNFYYYLNLFRIMRLIDLFSDEKNEIYTIETMAQMCGFKSKTTLNKYCQMILNSSPSETLKYIKMKTFDFENFYQIVHLKLGIHKE